jgi:hypothetical protein
MRPVIAFGPLGGGLVLFVVVVLALAIWATIAYFLLIAGAFAFGVYLVVDGIRRPDPPKRDERNVWRYGR